MPSSFRSLGSSRTTPARTALVVEGDDILGRSRHVGDDEADAWIEFARMPFDLAITWRGLDQLPA
jgi:hypothetical protein